MSLQPFNNESKDESEGMEEANLKIPTQPNPDFPKCRGRKSTKVIRRNVSSIGETGGDVTQIKKPWLKCFFAIKRSFETAEEALKEWRKKSGLSFDIPSDSSMLCFSGTH